MNPLQPSIPAEIRERILTAATALYEQGGRETFPPVGAVRQAARVDMNAASVVMREWRRAQTVQAAPLTVAIPDRVQLASSQALAVLWREAQALANEGLTAAQAAWEAERGEAEALRAELSAAFEQQAGALAEMEQRAKVAEARRVESEHQMNERLARLEAERDTARRDTAQAREHAARLTGQLEALQAQNAALLAALRP